MASALVVATEWFPKTSNFQVNFVQRETARLLHKHGRKVYYTVLEATDKEEEDARYHGITLAVAEEKPEAQCETPRIDRLMLHESFFPQLKDYYHVDLIVGHATADPEDATANAARCIQQGIVKFRKAKCVFFFHTIPTELGLSVGQIQELERNMLEFGSVGSFIVSVGPKIWNYFQNKISHEKRQLCYFPFVDRKFLLLPFEEHNVQYGIDVLSFYSTCTPTETPLGKFNVLARGFGKISDYFEFDDSKPLWKFIGMNIDCESFQERLHNMADSPSHLQVNTGLVESMDDLYTALQQCQLVVHGPQSDPFGIIGLMACTAGIPTLVTSNSGFGLFLKKYFPEIADNFVVSVGLNESEEDSDIWKKRVMKVLRNYPTALKQAQRLKKEIRSSGKEGVIAKSQRNFGQHCAQLVKQGGVIKKIEPDVNEERVKEKSGKHDEVVLTSRKRKLEEEENITFPPPLQETIQGVQSLISETTECIQSTSTGIRHPHQQKRKKDEIHNPAVSDIESANRSEQTAGSSHNKWLRQPREIGVHVNPDEIIFNERMTTEDVILITKAYISRRIFDNVRSMEDIPSAMEYAERIGIIPKATHPSSLIAVFECTTHEALETLWNDNNGGTLKRVFEKDIVTERVLTNFNASTISLITTIETWQYQKCALEIKYGIKEYSPSYYDNGEELEEYDDSFEISERMSESSEEIRMADELAFGSLFGDDPEETMTSVDDQPSLLSIECDGKHPPTLNPKVYLSEVIGGFDEIRPTSPSTNLSKYLGLVRVHQGHRLKTLLKRKPPILGLIGINKVLVNGSLQSCLRTQDDEERFDIKELQRQMDIYGSDTRFLVDQKSESLVVRGLTPSVNVTTVEDYVRVVDQLVNRWLDSACRLKKEKAERVIANNLLHFANDQVRTLEQKERMGSDDNIKISRIVTQQKQRISLFEERMRSLKTHISQKKEEGEGLVDTDELLKYLEVEILQMLNLPQSSTETHQRLQTVELASKSTLSDTGTELPKEMTVVGPMDIKSKSKIRKNWSDILIAAVNKDVSTVMSLIQQGEDVNAATEDSYTALHIAAAAGDLDMVKCVVEGGIDKDAGEKLKWTALHLASWNGHLNVVNYLIDAGANKEARNVDGSTALHWAARNGYVDIVKLLISKGADKNAVDKKRRTPQHFAAFYGHATTVKTFIDAGVNSEAKDVSEHTPLYDAAEQGKPDVINVLTDAGINKEATAKDRWTPPHAAAAKGHGKVTKLLIDAGSNMEAVTETDGYTVLHVAVHKGRAEVVQILLSAGANKEANAKDGYTPLLVASENGHVVVLKILVDAGVNVAACTLSDNHTSLHLAAKKGHNQVVKILVESGIDKEARTKNDLTALHLAAQHGHTNVVKTLTDAGLDKDIRGGKLNSTALHLAAKEGQVDVIKYLISIGSDIEAVDTNKYTPLHWAAQKRHGPAVKVLVDAGARTDAVDRWNTTPLSRALQYGHSDIAKLLME